jgi:hypothetical protein
MSDEWYPKSETMLEYDEAPTPPHSRVDWPVTDTSVDPLVWLFPLLGVAFLLAMLFYFYRP